MRAIISRQLTTARPPRICWPLPCPEEIVRPDERCELHRASISSVERGERNASILNLRLIARALRVPLTELLADEK
jgi:Helix-turn-helix